MLVALLMLFSLWLLLTKTRIGLVIQAALTHPEAVEALGHNVPRVFMTVFGVGTGLAGSHDLLLQRRHLMKKTFSAVCLALSLVSGHALAQSDYPNRPIKLWHGFGGSVDVFNSDARHA